MVTRRLTVRPRYDETLMAPSCYFTCSLLPVSLPAAAGYQPVRLMPREQPVQSSTRNLLSPHPMSCPYVTGLLPLAETALDTEAEARLVVPSGCDAMRRAGELLKVAFGERVFTLPVPRLAGGEAADGLARDLDRLLRWLESGGPAATFTGEAQLTSLAHAYAVPGGVFVISGPLDSTALLDLIQELGAQVSGLESCSSEERLRDVGPAPLDTLRGSGETRAAALLPLAQTVLEGAVCPRRPAADRKAHLRSRWEKCRPGAVLYARHSFCDPAAYDLLEVSRLAKEGGLPFMDVEIGLPLEITGPLRTRVEAFLETLLLDI